MAERPIFIPVFTGTSLVQEVPIRFFWYSGMAPTQKKKNVAALHERAAARGLTPLLEISTKSEREVGQKLSAFNLKVLIFGRETSLESVFQGSKRFEHGGPFEDLFWVDSRTAKRDPRLKESGRLVAFELEGKAYPTSPPTAFYDWLYLRALYPHRQWLERLQQCVGFTDIEYNPQRSLNCQARSCATFVALQKRGLLDEAIHSFDSFRRMLQSASL